MNFTIDDLLEKGDNQALTLGEMNEVMKYMDDQLSESDFYANVKAIFSDKITVPLRMILNQFEKYGLGTEKDEMEPDTRKVGYSDLLSSVTVMPAITVQIPEEGFSHITDSLLSQYPFLADQHLPATRGDVGIIISKLEKVEAALAEYKEASKQSFWHELGKDILFDLIKCAGTIMISVAISASLTSNPIANMDDIVKQKIQETFIDMKFEDIPEEKIRIKIEQLNANGGEKS